jgi:hypothetical protein
VLRRFVLLFALPFALAVTVACGPSAAQIQARNAVVEGMNASISTALKLYKSEQDTCTENAETKKEGKECLARVRKTWEPVWQAWDRLRKAEDVNAAYCELVSLFPKDVRPVPIIACP